MLNRPSLLLKVEEATLLIATLLVYQHFHFSWLLFAILFLTPDLFMLGYLANPRLGSALYNLGHTLFIPLILFCTAYLTHHQFLLPIATIWISHIAFDRLLGYGLKYPTHFKDTHLSTSPKGASAQKGHILLTTFTTQTTTSTPPKHHVQHPKLQQKPHSHHTQFFRTKNPPTTPQCDNKTGMTLRIRKPISRCLSLSLAALGCLSLTLGCGYHQAGSATHIPSNVRTLAVPIFATRTQAFHTEMVFTQAVVSELNTRTKYRIINTASPDADAILTGTILSQTVAPLTYDASSGQSSSYLLSITAKVVLTAHDGHILYRNDAILYREQYQSTQDLSGFIQEDNAAVNRVSKAFARALVSDMLESF